jgi:hypothetical protein
LEHKEATVTELTKEAVEISTRALTVPEQARTVEITDDESYKRAAEVLLQIKDLRRQIDEAFDPIISKAHEAHREALGQKKRADAPLVEAEGIIKPRIAAYIADINRKRTEEEARLREEERRKEEERRLEEAIKAEAAGQTEKAEEILAAPVSIAKVRPTTEAPRVAGVSIQKRWTYRIVDESKIPREYLSPDLIKIGAVVREFKGEAVIPGVEVFSEDNVAAGRR